MSEVSETNASWARHLPPGWHSLYFDLLDAIAQIDPDRRVTQAKQKFGGLVVYVERHHEDIAALLSVAEHRSKRICEQCGRPAQLAITKAEVVRTLCPEHSEGARTAAIGESLLPHTPPPLADLVPGVRDLPWPLFALDFEASGLGELTYPIEIGIARWMEPDAKIESWSALIKPADAWRQHRIWNEASEQIHGIKREELEGGIIPKQALGYANRLVGGHFAMCDGGDHDVRWLRHLAHAAGEAQAFELRDWLEFGRAVPVLNLDRMIAWKREQQVRHRAAEDARLILLAIAEGLTRYDR